MATEDHDLEPSVPEPRAALPSQGEDGRGDAPEPDFDLFDFPGIEDSFAGEVEALLDERRPATITATGAAERGGSTLSELMSVDDAELDLDEDIFGFGELFTATESEAGDDLMLEVAPRIVEEPAPEREEVLETPVAPRPRAKPAPVPSTPARAPRPVADRADRPRPERELDLAPLLVGVAEEASGESLLPVEPSSIFRDNLIEVLAILFLSVNAALLAFALQGGTPSSSPTVDVRADAQEPARTMAHVEPEAAPDAAPDAGTDPLSTPAAVAQEPTPLASYAELELTLAREALAAGEPSAARRRLYRLLANQDRFPVSADLMAASEYLIADSYFEEGLSLEGASR